MIAKKLVAVQKVLSESQGIRDWYATEHNTAAEDFTVQNVQEYGLCGRGQMADQIIADGEDDGILAPDEVRA